MCSHAGKHRRDSVTIAYRHPIDVTRLTLLRGDVQTPSSPDEGHGGLLTGSGNFHRHGAPRLGKRSAGQESSAPRSGLAASSATHNRNRKAPHWTPTTIKQSGQTSQISTPAHHSYEVASVAVEPSAIDDHEISVKTEDFLNGLTQSSRSSPRVDFCLDRKMAMLHQMDAASES